MKYKHVALLSVGHLVTDINQGALPALLPFFIAEHDLSYTAAAGIVFALNMASTIIQPLFGHAADRFSKPWLLLVGMLLAGSGLSLTGISSNYTWIFVLSIVSGVGIAAYHPEAARLVHFSAGERKGTAMSLFGIGGTLGFAIGPILATSAMLYWGLKGTLVLFVPVSVMAMVMATQLSKVASSENTISYKKTAGGAENLQDAWAPFIRLTLTIIGRSVLFYGLNTFIPLYWIHVLHESKAAGGMALAVYAGCGVLGNLLGGSLADRIGQKKVILFGFFGLAVLFPSFVWVDNARIAMLLLIPISLTLFGTYSPTIVLGQKYLPNRIGLSSGVTIGIAIAIGGGATPIIGKIADLHGIRFALASLAFLPVVTAALALTLPDPQKMNQAGKKRL
jgi:FSR family fosmidomycin resistance protein-like MFS transporter